MSLILSSIIVLGGVGVLSAAVLYFVSKRFHVVEDPGVALIEAELPGANCGGCGFSGCHDFAVNCAAAASLDGFNCPVGGEKVMTAIARKKGVDAIAPRPMVAVIHCNGTCENRPVKSYYDGAGSCAILSMVAAGTTDCAYGCLGEGDCVAACNWNAIKMNSLTGMPEIDTDLCTGCGVCVARCPRSLIELRPKGPRGMRVYVACANREKGAAAMKECKVSCIACGKCARSCTHDAIRVENNLAYIDFEKCKLCRKCVDQCPTHAIHAVNFPVLKPKTEEPAGTLEEKR